jgi:transcriptional regulator with GAF, ATPase, and Fis domain
VLANLATLYSALGDLPRARAHVSEALRLARATGSDHVLHNARVVEGTLLAREGQREEAEAILRDAMVQQRRLGAERSIETLLELADIQLLAHDLVAARETIAELGQSLDQVRTPRLALRARAQRARLMVADRDAGAVDALEVVRSEVELSGDRLLAIEVEDALIVAYEQRGHRERARVVATSVDQLRRAVAHDLPHELRESFLSRSAPALPIDVPVVAEVSAPAAPARSSTPPGPVARSSEWDKKYASIVGRSPKLHRVFHILDRVSQSDSTVLIVGESGTGKELVAEAIHKTSPRSRGPFVKLNCAALVESLLLSELFGHERGAFTGAHQRKAGRFEMAAGGTIFLDEIGDISPKTQVSLLRVLQAREFERVGGGRPIKLEARVVCATNRNLAQMVRDGTFREDLYYRLKGLAVDLPPLRERPEDIESLAGSFLERYALESGSASKVFSREAVAMMMRYAWPGNIRELENVVRSVALFADTPVIAPHHFDEYRELFEDSPAFGGPPAIEAEAPRVESLPVRAAVEAPRALEALRAPPPVVVPAPSAADEARAAADNDASMLSPIFHGGVPLAELKKKIQVEAIARALKLSRGNITKAAEILGMKRPRLSQIINANDELKALCLGVGR